MKLPKIVTHPLGLAGYSLALVFGLLGKYGPSDKLPWLVPVAVAMALVSLVGGLILANHQISGKQSSKPLSAESTPLQQKSSGDQSPNVANTEGPVHIEYGSTAKSRSNKKR